MKKITNIFNTIKKLNALKFLSLLLASNFFSYSFFSTKEVLSKDETNFPTAEYIKNFPKDNSYILGPGDSIFIKVSEFSKELNSIAYIDGEGIAVLKRLNKSYLSGLTINELTRILNKEYSAYVKNPDVIITVVKYRPISVFIDGEVTTTGQYILPGALTSEKKIETYNSSLLNKEISNVDISTKNLTLEDGELILSESFIYPTLVDLIRESGGITANADLSNIKVIRKDSYSNGSGLKSAKINLFKYIENSDTSQNLRIFDGDKIIIGKTTKPVLEQISKVLKSNLNPKFIKVYVGGRVLREGQITAGRTATLLDAISLAGGAKVMKGPVNFIRYNSDGSVDKRKFALRKSAKRGSYRNPYLKDGDVIFVDKSAFNNATEIITEVTGPFAGIVSSIGIYKVITD